jgi:copper type II ascorbate-dependent monooxygenase-like protein
MRLVPLVAILALVAGPSSAKPYLAKPAHGLQVKVGDYTVAPSQDLEVCEYRRLPNKRPMDVNGFRLRMPPGAHHFVVWSYNGNVTDDAAFPATPVPSVACAGIAPDETIPQVLIPIQQPNSRFRFPEGIALRLEPHQQVFLNPHMKNFGDTPIVPDVRFNFYRARKKGIRHLAEGLIIGNSTDIAVPAHGTQTLTAEWTAPVPLTMIELATHQHRLGTYGNIEIVPEGGGAPQRIYENTQWEHPLSYWPDPPIHLARGQKMRITCTWQNTDDHMVSFGPKTTDEMCFILGFYYRDDGDTAPATGNGCVSAKRGLLCPFAPAVAD